MYLKELKPITFPEYSGVKVNMMPFIAGDYDTIPDNCKQYIPLIEDCDIEEEESGKIIYLTVTESFVEAGKSQRRGGVHVERHPDNSWGGGSWGRRNGLYFATNVPDSTAYWNMNIEEPGAMGDCDHLVDAFNVDPILNKANVLYWLTEATPHQALEATASTFRQFFRLVTSEVSAWYALHSTPNPLGIVPAPFTKIIYGNKFA